METIKKASLGLCISSIFVFFCYLIEPETIYLSKTYVLVGIGVLSSIFQPTYNPVQKKRERKEDQTTGFILWSIYFALLINLIEAILFNFPNSYQWNAYTYLALIFALTGVWLRAWSYLTLGNHFSWNLRVQKDHRIITHGPYRYLAHPSYTGAFMTYLFICIFFHSWISMLVVASLLGYLYMRRIENEENLLVQELGEEYHDFCSSRYKLVYGLY